MGIGLRLPVSGPIPNDAPSGASLLNAIASLSSSRYQSGPEAAQRMVGLLIDGLRFGASGK